VKQQGGFLLDTAIINLKATYNLKTSKVTKYASPYIQTISVNNFD